MVITISSDNDVKSKLNGKTIKERVKLSGLKNVTIENVDFCSNEKDHMVQASDLQKVTFKNCRFHDKSTVGCAVNMTGTNTKDNVFDGCTWSNLTYSEGNGGEPLRLGLSSQANKFFNTTVKNCTFRELKADVETVSLKSCGNTIENCKHINCQSSFVVRHGHTNTIQNNEFEGSGGIRIYGKDNKILNNKFRNNDSSKFPPISLVNGNKKDEDLSADYTQVRNALIEGNEFDNCSKAIVWGRDSRTYKPENCRVASNRIIAEKRETTVIEFSGGASPDKNTFENNVIVGSKVKLDSRIKSAFRKEDPTAPDPVVVVVPPPPTPQPEEGTEQQPPVPPEQPQTEPNPDTVPIPMLCSVCNIEEAKKKLSILVCPEHAEKGRDKMHKLLDEMRVEAQVNKQD